MLKLTQWEMRSAVEAEILRVLPNGLVDGEDVAEALRDYETFLILVHNEHPVNATQAARLLGVSVRTFKRIIACHPIPMHSIKPFLRDRVTTYWRQEDVLSLRPYVRRRGEEADDRH